MPSPSGTLRGQPARPPGRAGARGSLFPTRERHGPDSGGVPGGSPPATASHREGGLSLLGLLGTVPVTHEAVMLAVLQSSTMS